MKIKMVLFALLILSIAYSGCARKVSIVQGIDDYVAVPKGTVISIPMMFEGEEKVYSIKTQKAGAFYSVDAQVDVLKARAK